MAIYLKRNSNSDPWYSQPNTIMSTGEIVKLIDIPVKLGSTRYPPTIRVRKSAATGDTFHYKASLSSFDYVGSAL